MNSSEPLATISLSEPGDLIAATPALLGFVPRSSLVASGLGGASGRRLGLALRIDLPPPEYVGEATAKVVTGVLLDHPAAVVVIVVGPGGDAGPPAVEFVERVVAGLAEHGVDACLTLWTESTAARSRWRCYGECLCTGLVPPSSTSPLMAAARAEGRVVRADRSDLERLVAPLHEAVLRRREALLDAAVDAEAEATFAAFADPTSPPTSPRTSAPAASSPAASAPAASSPAASAPAASTPPASAPAASTPPATTPDPSNPPAPTSGEPADGAAAEGSVARSAPAADVSSGAAARKAGDPAAGKCGAGERWPGERWPDPRAEVIEGIAVLDAALDAAQEAVAAERGGGGDAGAGPPVGPANAPPGGGGDDWLDDARVVALTRALQIPVVRDAAVAACVGSRPAAAAALWAAMARGTPDPEAAEPAALLALTGLLQGDGALANVALERAEAAWPGHHLTQTLRGLAAAGIHPSELRACLTGVPAPQRSRQPRTPAGTRRGRAPRPARRRKRRG